MIDPTPDIRVLFQEFNKEFFWQRLDEVEVRWSPRMTSYVSTDMGISHVISEAVNVLVYPYYVLKCFLL